MRIRTMILSLIAATTMQAQQRALPVYLNESKSIEERVDDALSRMTLDEKIAIIHAQSKFSAPGVKRLGIPDMWTDDGPHGVRPDVLWDDWVQAGHTNDSCVAFPALTCLAATWNPCMARIYGENLAEEALYRDKDMILGPGVNIFRTPLGGRNFEYMGEDPWLASRMVVPYVQGLQSKGVSACVKHYALNNDEEYRHQVNVKVSDRALHEIYLPAFRAAVQEGGAWSIMGAYNLYQDQHNCHNATLLNKILKQDWGFDGVVVSDWGGAHDTDQAITNGLDLEFGTWTDGLTMGKTNAYDNYYLAEAYKKLIMDGKYTTKELDDKVRRVLRLHFRTTMNRQRPYGALCSEAHYDAARKIAGEGIVLLKNNKIKEFKNVKSKNEGAPLLPLDMKNYKKILVVGENAIKPMTVGGGSSSLKVQREITPLVGLRSQLSIVNSQLLIDYARGYVGDTTSRYNGVTMDVDLRDLRSAEELRQEAVEKAREADVVIIFGGLNKADYQDSEGHDRKEYNLPYGQDALVEAIAQVNPRVVFVGISGNCFAMPWIDRVPAIVQGWFLGSEAGTALASMLTGETEPTGHLPFTWYARLEDCGAHATDSYPGTWRQDNSRIIDEEYREGIFVGYRWTDRQKKVRPLFPFGHGLSYTSFRIDNSELKIDNCPTDSNKAAAKNCQLSIVNCQLTNTGSRPGAQVVQLYISDKKASVERPVKELKAFQKVWLEPGETKTVTLEFDRQALSFWDEQTSSWKFEPGKFEALIGTSAGNVVARLPFTLE